MRISAIKTDPGFSEMAAISKGLKIFVDDEHIPTAHTADTDLGKVWMYQKNDRGRIKTVELTGNVRIEGLE